MTLYEKIIFVLAQYPEMRVGQLLSNAAQMGGWENSDIFYCPNEILEKGLDNIIKQWGRVL